ncbi:MAG: helix-turn-helix domain-containing protein [Clostridia bacterium]|nr:helix-turn-helix domain-containing protein [Clostridia bacterium]
MSKYDFGNKLYALRTEKNLTQKDLAKILGVSDKAVSKWETGEAMPRLKTLQAIADCFSVSYEALLSQSSEEAETTETADTEAKEAAESNYERFYNKRLKKDKNELKVGIIFLAIFILINFCTIFFGNFSATFLGVMMPNIFQNIIFNLLPIFVSIGFWFFTNKTFSQIDNLDIEEYATRYFPTMSVPLIIYSVLIAIKSLIKDDIGGAILFAGTALLLVVTTIFSFVKKENCIKYINIITIGSYIFFILNIVTIVNFLIDGINSAAPFFFIFLSSAIIKDTNNLVSLIHTLKKVDKPTNPQKIKLKKIVIRAFIVITVIFIIIAIILTLFPGIVLKYTLTKTTSNPNITFFEDYDLAFEEDEATRIQISDITIEIPNKFVVEDRSIDKDINTYNYFFDDQLIAWIKKYPKGKTLLDTETEGFENMMIKTFGAYPRNEFEYKKLIYTLDAEDINIFNFTQAITYTSLINIRDMFTMDGYYDITLYTNNEVSAEIMSSTLSDIGIYSATLYIPLDEYDYYIHFNSKREPIETFYKMLNSIELA